MTRRNLLGQRGDTIVEVLLALAVLGAVLGGAYVVTNRNTVINRASQERTQAIKLAESQLERLKAAVEADNTLFDGPTSDIFCVSQSGSLVSSSSADCSIDSAGNPASSEPLYRVAIRRTDTLAVGTNPNAGRRFEIILTWANSRGSDDTVTYLYEMYR